MCNEVSQLRLCEIRIEPLPQPVTCTEWMDAGPEHGQAYLQTNSEESECYAHTTAIADMDNSHMQVLMELRVPV